MEDVQSTMKFGAFDLMLLGFFFISYSVLSLMQIAFLYGRRYIVFAAVTVGAVVCAQGFRLFAFDEFCAERSSVIVCADDGQALVGLGMVWVIVCAAMLVIFGVLQVIGRARDRTGRTL